MPRGRPAVAPATALIPFLGDTCRALAVEVLPAQDVGNQVPVSVETAD